MAFYTLPTGTSASDTAKVKDWQRKLKVKDDGIWGPKTQAAYDAWSGAGKTQSYTAPMGARS